MRFPRIHRWALVEIYDGPYTDRTVIARTITRRGIDIQRHRWISAIHRAALPPVVAGRLRCEIITLCPHTRSHAAGADG